MKVADKIRALVNTAKLAIMLAIAKPFATAAMRGDATALVKLVMVINPGKVGYTQAQALKMVATVLPIWTQMVAEASTKDLDLAEKVFPEALREVLKDHYADAGIMVFQAIMEVLRDVHAEARVEEKEFMDSLGIDIPVKFIDLTDEEKHDVIDKNERRWDVVQHAAHRVLETNTRGLEGDAEMKTALDRAFKSVLNSFKGWRPVKKTDAEPRLSPILKTIVDTYLKSEADLNAR